MINLSNFANLFPFKPNSSAPAPLNTLLDNEDVPIQRLLDEQTFVNQFKMQNPKLLQYLKYDKYKTLIQFITVVGPQQDNKRTCKYPFLTCEILTIENNSSIQFLLPEKQLWVEEEVTEEIDVQQQFQEIINSPEKEDTEVSQKVESNQQIKGEIGLDQFQNIQQQTIPQKKTRIVKRIVKKTQTKKIKKSVPPLINELFKYIQGQVNYTLAGYFSRILTVLFNKKSSTIINYFFSNKKYIKMIDHLESRSIAQLIIKFLTIDSLQFITERQQLLDLLLSRLSRPEQINMMGNLSYVLCDVIEKFSSTIKTINGSKQMLIYIYSIQFCQRLVGNVVSDQSDIVSNYNTPILLGSLTSIRNLLENKQQTKNSDLLQKFQQITSFIKNNLGESSQLTELFKNFFLKALERLNVTRRSSSTLGFGRSKLIEVLFYLLKFDFFNIQSVLPTTKFFERLFNLVRQYELNNVLHNQILKILTFILELEQGSPLITNLIQKGNLLTFIYQQVVEDQQIIQSIKNKKRIARKGYIGHIVKLGQLLLKVSATNNQINQLFSDQKWVIIKEFIDRETFQNQKNLAGFATKKTDVYNLLFNKEDILALHHAFLVQTPVTTYPQPVQQKDDEITQIIPKIQELRIQQPPKQVKQTKEDIKQKKEEIKEKEQIPENKETKQVHTHHVQHHHHPKTQQEKQKQQIAEKIEQVKQKEVQEGIAIYSNIKYWKDSKTIQYEIDDLINDLD